MEAHKKRGVVFHKRRQKHLYAPSGSQQSPWLMEMIYKLIKEMWDSLQKYVNVFLPDNGHTDIGCTLQGKITVYVKDGTRYSGI